MAVVEQRVVRVDGVRTFYRCLPGEGPPAVFVHGNPTHSEAWLPFLERMSGPAIALDLPGWGFSETPDRARFDYSMHGLGRFVGRFLEVLEVAEHSLVVDDWGAVALIDAQARPALVRRLVLIDTVPLLPGYRWHWVADRLWRRRAARRARQPDHHPGEPQASVAAGLARAAGAARGFPRPDLARTPPGHLARPARPLSLRRSRPARGGGVAARRTELSGAGRLGPGRSLHPGAVRACLRRTTARGRAGRARASGSLAVARSARDHRSRGRFSQRLSPERAHGLEGWAEQPR